MSTGLDQMSNMSLCILDKNRHFTFLEESKHRNMNFSDLEEISQSIKSNLCIWQNRQLLDKARWGPDMIHVHNCLDAGFVIHEPSSTLLGNLSSTSLKQLWILCERNLPHSFFKLHKMCATGRACMKFNLVPSAALWNTVCSYPQTTPCFNGIEADWQFQILKAWHASKSPWVINCLPPRSPEPHLTNDLEVFSLSLLFLLFHFATLKHFSNSPGFHFISLLKYTTQRMGPGKGFEWWAFVPFVSSENLFSRPQICDQRHQPVPVF